MLSRYLPPMIRRVRQVLAFIGVVDPVPAIVSITLAMETGTDTIVSMESALAVTVQTENGVDVTLDAEGG